MSEETQTPRRDRSETDKFIPPPMDPYARYQTPYERQQSPEPNPFIEFRRFADKQFSDIFSGLQTFANFPKMFGVEDGMKELREQLERDMKEMIALQKARSEEMDSSNTRRLNNNGTDNPFLGSTPTNSSSAPVSRYYSAERTNQDNESKSDTEISQGWPAAIGIDGKEWHIDPSSGLAVPKGSSISKSSEAEQEEDRKTRWKRGFRNCPELKKYRGKTELDMYESYEDLQKPRQPAESSAKDKTPWSSWLSAYGHDGLQKAKMASQPATDTTLRQGEKPLADKCDVKTYRASQTARMNPLKNDHEFMPWITLSPYSPAFLANPDTVHLEAVTMHNGCEGGCDRPLHLQSQRFSNRQSNTEQDRDFRTKLSAKAPWIDAFEDLLSLEKTGKMPDRDPNGCTRQKYMTENWVCDLVKKGLLGPKWWLDDGCVTRDSRDDPKQTSRAERARILQQQIEENLRNTMIEPLILALNADIAKVRDLTSTRDNPYNESHGLLKGSEEASEQSQRSIAAKDTPAVRRKPEKKMETPQPPSAPLDTASAAVKTQQPTIQATKPNSSIISTLTSTTSRTLSDGSVETKRVLKKRFADGNEESEESTEVVYPQVAKSSLGSDSSKQEKRQGWFWT